MFLVRPRRPLIAATVLGGTAFLAHRAGRRSAAAKLSESSQEARLSRLEAGEVAEPQGEALVQRLRDLSELRDSGVLTDDEFAAAKQKLLAA